MSSSSGPSHAKRIAGHASSRMAWLWVAAIPIPSHSAVSRNPAVPSHGRSRTSRANNAGSSSPSATAVVSMNDVTPDPLPKCLSPLMR